ncbi:MAG: glycosyl hydrolase family 65 protein [Candidatus Omnitrophota bacterium]
MEDQLSLWKISFDRFNPKEEILREALCTLGNGYFGTRGAALEFWASARHSPGTYIAGVYNKLSTFIAGKNIINEDMVNCPNWLFLTFKVENGDWVNLETCKILAYNQELDLRYGVLIRTMRLQDISGRITTIEDQRIVHMQSPHLAAISYSIIPENYEGWIVVKSALDGKVQNKNVERYRDLNTEHLKDHSMGRFSKNGMFLSVKTNQSNIEICQASKLRIFAREREIENIHGIVTQQNKIIFQELRLLVQKGRKYKVEKIVAIYTSKDKNVKNPLSEAVNSVKKPNGFDALLELHKKTWVSLWDKFDIKIKGDAFSQRLVRFHIFHLLQTASIHNVNIDAGLPARGLHGESYRGHIFWDSIFAMHLFDFHLPEISKVLLLYRYRRLVKARKYAQDNGHKGAMFPWQSGASGDEETQTLHLNPKSGRWGPDYSRNQRHVSFAIAYNIWQYWDRTADLDFLKNYGAEMLLSIAQFGSSLTKFDSKDKKYHTEGLMGPDEFHEMYPKAKKPGFRDNAYTNILIVWTLLKAKEVLSVLPQEDKEAIIKKIGLDNNELKRWEEITKKMNIVVNDNGIISQFEGYFDLKELNLFLYKIKYGNIHRMDRILKAEDKSPDEYKIAKQADALMIFYLLPLTEIKDLFNRLGYEFDKDLLKNNYEYYIKRTSHGSTLSKVVHCYLSHILGKNKESMYWFTNVLKSDIYDTQGGTTKEGIHIGVMGGSIDIVIRCFVGLNIEKDIIKINPNIPNNWQAVKFKLLFRGNWISVSLTSKYIAMFLHREKQEKIILPVEIGGNSYNLKSGKIQRINLKSVI